MGDSKQTLLARIAVLERRVAEQDALLTRRWSEIIELTIKVNEARGIATMSLLGYPRAELERQQLL